MKKAVKILAVIGGLLIAVVVAGVAILSSLDFNEYKGLIAEKAKEATGRTLTIDGNLDLEISFSPKIAVDGVTFENAEWGSEPAMMTLDTFKAEVELLPLLSSEIRVNRVILSGLRVLAETNADGTPNWQFEAAEAGEAGEAESAGESASDGGSPGALPVVQEVQIDDVTLIYKDGVSGKTTSVTLEELTLAADGKGAPLELAFAAVFNDERIEGSGTLGSIDTLIGGGAPFPVKLSVSALGTETLVDGAIADIKAAKGIDLQIGVSGGNLADTAARGAKLAGQDAAPPLTANPFTLTARASDPAGGYALDGIGLTIGETDLSGAVTANLSGARPAVRADLTSRRFDLDDLIVRSEAESGGDAAASGSGGGVTTASADAGGKKRVFPADPLPLDGLKAADAEVQMKVAELVAAPWRLTDVALEMTLINGNLNISKYAAKAFEGTIDGSLALDGSKATPTLALKTQVRGLDYGQLSSFAMKQDKPMAHGQVDVDVDLNGAGGSVRALMAGLTGDIRAVTQDGRIDSNALNIVSGDVLSALPFMGESKDDKTIECGVVEFNIKQGQAAAKYLLFETGGISVVGEGGMNLAEEELALVFDPRAKKASMVSVAEVPVAVKGTFAEPEFVPDATAIAGNLLSTAGSIGTAIATGGLSLLVENVAGGAVKRVDETDYCCLGPGGQAAEAGRNLRRGRR
jgi:uncharacterized protein involved in outer membrane biogenesis